MKVTGVARYNDRAQNYESGHEESGVFGSPGDNLRIDNNNADVDDDYVCVCVCGNTCLTAVQRQHRLLPTSQWVRFS